MKSAWIATVTLSMYALTLSGQKPPAQNDSMSGCPMHAQHQAKSPHDDALKQRGDHGMGFSQDKTTHHFLITESGGVIQVTANAPDDKKSLDEIKMHLQHIAKAFQEGDFEIPMFVHDQTPPGVPAMTRLKSDISYKYEPVKNGGRVVISTSNSEALTAIHDFIKFQIEEHKTEDAK